MIEPTVNSGRDSAVSEDKLGTSAKLSSVLVGWLSTDVMPHEPHVRGWLRRSGVSRAESDDIIQEAYSCIARSANPEVIRSGRAYFFTTVRCIVLEHLRRQRVVRFINVAEIDRLDIVDDGISAERALAARQELALVWRLIDTLPERTRRILLLRRVEGLSQREVAQTVGVSENVVEHQLSRGLKMLMSMLAAPSPKRPKAGRTDEDEFPRGG
jgi:RNA polymerase sigma factor (sigma-70 family)